MFVIDAWFDVTTSRGGEFLIALFLAVFAELPLALVCAWTAVNAERVRERAYRNLQRWRCDARACRDAGSAERALSRRPARATKTSV